jgi:hypothetical protein
MPIIIPTLLPTVLPLPPPNFFAPNIGIMLSNRNMNNAMQKQRIKKRFSILTIVENRRRNNPNQEVNGPGIIGRKLPAIPSKMKNPENPIIITSIS